MNWFALLLACGAADLAAGIVLGPGMRLWLQSIYCTGAGNAVLILALIARVGANRQSQLSKRPVIRVGSRRECLKAERLTDREGALLARITGLTG